MTDSTTITTPTSRPHPLSARERMALKNGLGASDAVGAPSPEEVGDTEGSAVSAAGPAEAAGDSQGMVEAFLSAASSPSIALAVVPAEASTSNASAERPHEANESSADVLLDPVAGFGIVGSAGSGADYAVPVPAGWFDRPTPTRMERRASKRRGFLDTIRDDTELFSVALTRRDIVLMGSCTALGLFVGSLLL